jgi:hypothetical protein
MSMKARAITLKYLQFRFPCCCWLSRCSAVMLLVLVLHRCRVRRLLANTAACPPVGSSAAGTEWLI